MAVEREVKTITLTAAADLSTHQYKAVTLAGAVAANHVAVAGILRSKPESGEHASVGWFGDMKYYAGGAIAAGGQIRVTASGWLTQCVSGSYAVGRAIEAVTSGSVGRGYFNFANTVLMTTSQL